MTPRESIFARRFARYQDLAREADRAADRAYRANVARAATLAYRAAASFELRAALRVVTP